jgi:glycosyltransferase involved in cell wall biosynthesis
MKPKLKVVVLWHAGMVPGYLAFFRRLAALPELRVSLITPPYYDVAGQRYQASDAPVPGLQWVKLAPRLRMRESTLLYPGLGRALDRLQPDLLHLKQEPNHLVCLQAAAWVRRRSPGTLLVFETLQNLAVRSRWPWPWVEERVFAASDAAVAITEEIAQVLRGFGYAKPVCLLPLWVEGGLFTPGPAKAARRGLGLDPARYTIGFCGRLTREKGLFVLLEALARLRMPWQGLWVDQGPDRAALLDRAQALGIRDRLLLTGALPQPGMVQAYRAMDVLALPSLTLPAWKEQFGRALAEAMACGVPCLGSDSGAIPEVMGPGGLSTPEGDAPALLKALQRLADPGARKPLALAARRQAARYSAQVVAEEHRDFYLDLARRRGRGLPGASFAAPQRRPSYFGEPA